MKLFSKLFFLIVISLSAYARPIIIIGHSDQLEQAQVIERILIERFNIPAELIEIYQKKSPCGPIEEAIAQLCIDENKQMQIVHYRKEITASAFQVFLPERRQNSEGSNHGLNN